MEGILPYRRPLLGLVSVGLALGLEIDRGAVVGAADGAREERAVVARIIPGEPAPVMGVLPQADRELDRLDRLLAVQSHRLAVGLDLLATPGPQVRIPEARGITESMAQCLAEGMAFGFELLTGCAVFVPS